MLQGERIQFILATIKTTGTVRVAELAKTLGTSENSIRRDLRQLELQKCVNRIHGGAVLVEHGGDPIVPLRDRTSLQPKQKQAIARKAMELVVPGSTIILDSGSTTYALAELIERKADSRMKVITNAIDIATLLSRNDAIELLLPGGTLLVETGSLVGPFAEAFFPRIHADIGFFGATAFSLKTGFTNNNMIETGVKRTMVASAKRIVALLDSSKLGRESTYPFADRADVIVTSEGVHSSTAQAIRDRGIELIIAPLLPA